jgi:hypothetical protein
MERLNILSFRFGVHSNRTSVVTQLNFIYEQLMEVDYIRMFSYPFTILVQYWEARHRGTFKSSRSLPLKWVTYLHCNRFNSGDEISGWNCDASILYQIAVYGQGA